MAVSIVPEPASGSVSLVALAANAARTVNGVGSAVTLPGRFTWVTFELLVHSGGGGGTTLDVWIQQSHDGGVNWDDICHLAPVAGAVPAGGQGQAAGFAAKRRDAGPETHPMQDGLLAASSVVDYHLARVFRARWTIAGGGPYTFQVLAAPRS